MKRLIDVACPGCGRLGVDVWVVSLEPALLPMCDCGVQTERAWLSAPSVTPNGIRPERNTDRPKPATVDTKAIARETQAEIEQKWQRYGDEKLAEQHVGREINHKAGMADEVGNPTPIPKPAPITMATMTAAAGA